MSRSLLIRALFCVSALFFFGTVASLEQISPAQAQTTKIPLAVLDLLAKGDAMASEASILTDRVRSLVVQSQAYQVMEREAMDKIMREQGFQSTQDCTGEACSIQMGRLLAVKQIMTGSLTRLNQNYALTLRVIDTEKGLILREEFLDCACSLETLTRDRLPNLVALLTGAQAKPALLPETSHKPIRVLRPWLLLGEGGNINVGKLGVQFNFNEYFALHGGPGYGFANDGQVNYPGDMGYRFAQIMGFGGAKVYFNPHDLAGFVDLHYASTDFINGMLGIEYRHPQGLTFSASGGVAFDIRVTSPRLIFGGGVGFSF